MRKGRKGEWRRIKKYEREIKRREREAIIEQWNENYEYAYEHGDVSSYS